MRSLLLILFVFLSLNKINSQTWKYSEDSDPFEGKTLYIMTRGYGGEFPYEKPYLNIRYRVNSNDLNVYITGLGYTGCDSNALKISYNNNPKNVKEYFVSESVGNDALFIKESEFDSLFKDLKNHSVISVRFENRCTVNTFSFSLNGSSLALNKLLEQTNDYNTKASRVRAEIERKKRAEAEERQRQKNIIADQKGQRVNQAKKRLLDSMISKEIPLKDLENKFKFLLSNKLDKLYDINPNLNEIVDVEIKPHFNTLLKKLGKYKVYLKFNNGDLSVIGKDIDHFNKNSDIKSFESRSKKFINDLKYLRFKDYQLENLEITINSEARNIFDDIVYDSIIAVRPNTGQGKIDFDEKGLVDLYFTNTKDLSIKKPITGYHYLEFDSPIFKNISDDLNILRNLLSPYINDFDRLKLLKIRKSLYGRGMGINNIDKFELLKKRGDVLKVLYQKGYRQLKAISLNGKELTIMVFVDTTNKKLI